MATFKDFLEAKEGFFNGFDFCEEFHKNFNKNDAVFFAVSDDCGNAEGVHVGADGVAVYFMTLPQNVKKIVRFNYSVYAF